MLKKQHFEKKLIFCINMYLFQKKSIQNKVRKTLIFFLVFEVFLLTQKEFLTKFVTKIPYIMKKQELYIKLKLHHLYLSLKTDKNIKR